jgi:hypothetical protein
VFLKNVFFPPSQSIVQYNCSKTQTTYSHCITKKNLVQEVFFSSPRIEKFTNEEERGSLTSDAKVDFGFGLQTVWILTGMMLIRQPVSLW